MLTRIAISMATVVAALVVIARIVDHGIGVRMRLHPAEFRSKDFRANRLLADVPLHDVWVAHLSGCGEGKSMRDVRGVMSGVDNGGDNLVATSLMKLRMVLGKVFGWDDQKHFDSTASYIHRLSERDWRSSFDEPGEQFGMFRVVYTFERESVAEIMNGTVHAFLVMAMEPSPDGCNLYHAIFVKPVSWITPFYMALIDPLRRLFIYPAMIETIERSWDMNSGAEKVAEHRASGDTLFRKVG